MLVSLLELIVGPMFSGKTTRLIDRYNDAKLNCTDDEILVINHVIDSQRYKNNSVVSHNGIEIPAISITKLSEATEQVKTNKYLRHIFINEGQFFEDLREWVIDILDTTDIWIIICGLDSDFKREKFGQMWDLIPHAHYVNKLYGKCNECPGNSIFTHRISQEEGQVVVGTINYIPVCRECYVKLNPNTF